MNEHQLEINAGERFEFGKNWSRFLLNLSPKAIANARKSLLSRLKCQSLAGKTFLDIGSGSGLSSLVARQAGAKVVSFDYDSASVACTQKLKNTYFPNDPDWQVMSGSVLNPQFLQDLGQFDYIYSWGVLHHTGDMWLTFRYILQYLTHSRSTLFIAIYNDQGTISDYWTWVKKAYCRSKIAKILLTIAHLPYPFGASLVARLLTGRLFNMERGMQIWTDYIDWLGGYPFEVAHPKEIIQYFTAHQFVLKNIIRTHSLGCNEFVFQKKGS